MSILQALARPGRGLMSSTSSFFYLRLFFPFLCCLLLCPVICSAKPQAGSLATVNYPHPGSTFSAGDNIRIVVDVSGNGTLPAAASIPGSGFPTRMDALNIYLVSTQINITIAKNSEVLTRRPGETTKRFDYTFPSCLSSGKYNVTFHEYSHRDDQPCFFITPVAISITNPRSSARCANEGSLIPSVQEPMIPPPDATFTRDNLAPLRSSGPLSPNRNDNSLSPLGSGSVRLTPTVPAQTTTIILVSAITRTVTESASRSIFTTTAFATFTTTAVITPTVVNMEPTNSRVPTINNITTPALGTPTPTDTFNGLVPVNASSNNRPLFALFFLSLLNMLFLLD